MSGIPDFNDTELWVTRAALTERYGKAVTLELADSELRLDPESTVLTTCPTIFWSERAANFVVFKVGDGRYRCQFFYGLNEQYGTGRDVYDDIGECITHLLQLQADHESRSNPPPHPRT
ncbi:hypothetical protein [Acidiferrobacter sp.]|jgi:hypothetical protein|uniref:hypothetical protein n=1 Tax=Acidiferrobacter sp. TaxID=1872107 RepID=UPI00260C56A6|nr:hypothetical protein [Acidiferrobacter sp.]